ncbi:MAG: GtrA family protein, partial [Bacteroidetes bacterium]|nr:GtrA family protein [Bacteroidota bacterium]
MKFTDIEFRKFILSGAVNSILTYLIYVVFLQILNYKLAYSFSYLSGIFIAYYFHSRYVFRENLHIKKALQYPLVYIISYAVGISLIYILVDILGINKMIAPLIVVLLVTPISFITFGFMCSPTMN